MKERTKSIFVYGVLILSAVVLVIAIFSGTRQNSSNDAGLTRNEKYLNSKLAYANHLASKGDARSLTVAFMLMNSGTLLDPSGKNSRSKALESKWIALAAARAPKDPVVAWVETMHCFSNGTCNRSNSLERLERLDADNAAVYLLSFNQAEINKDPAKRNAAFSKAANSRHFDWYYNRLGAVSYEALSDWRPDISTFDRASDAKLLGLNRRISNQDYRKVESLNIAIAYMVPTLQGISDFCNSGEENKNRLRDCIKFFELMRNDKTTLSKAVGLTKLAKITAVLPEGASYREELRQFFWVRENYNKLNIGKPETESSFIRQWPKMTEWDAIALDLEFANITFKAPKSWLPENESMRSLVLTGLDPKN